MSIEKDIARVYALERQAKELAKDLGCNVHVNAIQDEDCPGEVDAWTYVGDHTHHNFCNKEHHWDYSTMDTPIISEKPENIVSFTMPPKEKSPDTGQSDQGMSIGKLAHEHYTPHVQEVQDE